MRDSPRSTEEKRASLGTRLIHVKGRIGAVTMPRQHLKPPPIPLPPLSPRAPRGDDRPHNQNHTARQRHNHGHEVNADVKRARTSAGGGKHSPTNPRITNTS